MTARYVMIGGFLGAGKTTAIEKLAEDLTSRGQRVGLITNDQSSGLVDTALLQNRGFPVEEIAGGCFCCRFPSLKEAADRLVEAERPDVFLAEPVGSCTDLVATVSYPLRRMYGEDYSVAPLSVLLDPLRLARILGLRQGRAFSEKVVYVFEKQMEEAHFLVLNKCDLIEDALRDELSAVLAGRFPQARLFQVSAREGSGLDDWFEAIRTGELPCGEAMELDYDRYADGEALLGWLNATLGFEAAEPGAAVDGNAFLLRLGERLRTELHSRQIEIAHLKMTLMPREGVAPLGGLAAVSTTGSDRPVEARERLDGPIEAGTLIVNLRAEADPALLDESLAGLIKTKAGDGSGVRLTLEHQDSFRPGRPVPTHRITGSP